MIVAPIKILGKKKKDKTPPVTQKSKIKPTLKELQNKEYPFSDFDIPRMLNQLLELKLIELPPMKHPYQAG